MARINGLGGGGPNNVSSSTEIDPLKAQKVKFTGLDTKDPKTGDLIKGKEFLAIVLPKNYTGKAPKGWAPVVIEFKVYLIQEADSKRLDVQAFIKKSNEIPPKDGEKKPPPPLIFSFTEPSSHPVIAAPNQAPDRYTPPFDFKNSGKA